MTLAKISIPALCVYQVVLPAFLIYSARQPRMGWATAAYRRAWARAWISVEIACKMVLVLCHIAFLSKVDEPWVQGRLQIRSWVMLGAIIAYYCLLLSCQPYRSDILVMAGGSLF